MMHVARMHIISDIHFERAYVKEENTLREADTDRRILQWILNKYCGRVPTRSICLKVG
jgi:hypothetical protein